MHRWQRRLWISGVALGATLILITGLLIGAFRIGVQLVPDYRADVEQRVAELLKTRAQIQDMDLIWRGRYPTLLLRDVALGSEAEGGLQLRELRIGFSLLRLIQGDLMPRRLQMRGTFLQLSLRDGQLELGGVRADGSSQQAPQTFLDQLRRIGHIELSDARLRWIDHDHQRPVREFKLDAVNARSTFRGMEVRVDAGLLEQKDSRVRADLVLKQAPWRLSEIAVKLEQLAVWDELQAIWPQMPLLRGKLHQLGLEASWQGGRWRSARIGFDLENFAPQASTQQIERWRGALLLSALGDGLRAELQSDELIAPSGRWPEQLLSGEWQPGDGDWGRVSANAQYLRLDDLQMWLPLLPEKLQQHWRDWRPAGEIHQLVLQTSAQQPWPRVAAELQRVHLAAHDAVPGLREFSGALSMDQSGGRLMIDSQDMVLEAPRLFGQPLDLQQLSGNVSWERLDDGWQISAPGLHYEAMNLGGVGRLELNLGPQPTIDLDLNFYCPDPTPWLAYQPLSWKRGLRDWLGKAVGKANISAGRVELRGALQDFPYVDGKPGLFRVDLDLEDTQLRFAPDWPQVEMESAKLVIEGRSLRVDAFNNRLGKLTAATAQASIASFADTLLEVRTQVAGDAADIWEMLGQSNLRRTLGGTLDALALSGNTEVDLALDLPLRNLDGTDYRIAARFDRAALWTRYWPDPIQKLRGEVLIDREGLRSRELTAALAGIPLKATLQPQDGLTRLEAEFAAAMADLPPSVPLPGWLRRRASGDSQWRFEMQIGAEADGQLRFATNLLGMAWDLPAPFGKQADELRKLDVLITPGQRTRIHVAYAQLLGFDGLIGDSGLGAARVHLGADVLPAGAPGWWVEGQLAQASLSEWLPLIQDLVSDLPAASTDDPGFGGLVLRVGELAALGQRLAEVRMQLTQDENDWVLGLSSSRTEGELRIPRQQSGDRLQLKGAFSRLSWLMAEDVSGGEADPRDWPSLDLAVENFALNDVSLGQMDLRLQSVSQGVQIQHFTIDQGERREVDISGLWLKDDLEGESAALDFSIDTRSFGSWLLALGYADNIAAERGQISGQLNWTPDPQGLGFASLNGDLKFDFSEGQLLNVEPGAGRVLGLFSVTALPRRFFLDFSDVVNSGLGFDEMSGQFTLKQGVAHTDDLTVRSPSLRILARGEVDLAQRLYDQTITIYPGLSSGVSLAATVLGGPVLGIFTLLAQELLDKPLDQVTQISYHLSGDWENPQVSRLQ